MTEKLNRIFVKIIFGVFISLLCLLVAGKVTLYCKNRMHNEKVEVINWENLYPFNTVVNEIEIEKDTEIIETELKYEKGFVSKFNTVGKNWSKLMWGYGNISKAGYLLRSKLSDPSIGEQYIRLKNGHWISLFDQVTDEEIKEAIIPYASLQKYLKENGIGFTYFFVPTKECTVDDEYPAGVVTDVNEKIDRFIKELSLNKVEYVDLRKELHKDGLDHYAMFFRTDHHWTSESGLWASEIVTRKIRENLGIEIRDASSYGEFKNVTYGNAEFGSYGAGVTRFIEQPEDFTIPYPTFETEFRIEVPYLNIDKTGSFGEVFVDEEGLKKLSEDNGGYAYEKLLYGIEPYVKITNMNNPDGPKILLIRDSYACAVAPYLASSCSELVLIDTRSNCGNFTGSIIEVINQFGPDAVFAFQHYPQKIILNK